MEKLTERCTHCKGDGKDRSSGYPCRLCGGGGSMLTEQGNEVRKLVVALLDDDDVRTALSRVMRQAE